MKVNKTRKVVVTGMGSLTAFGQGVNHLWHKLIAADSAIKGIRRFCTDQYRCKLGAEVDDKVARAHLAGLGAGNLSRNAIFAIVAMNEAIQDSKLLIDKHMPTNTGISLGSGLGGLYFSEDSIASLSRTGPSGVSPMTVPSVDPNAIVSSVARKWGISGQQFTVSTACSSSSHAIGLAMDMIRHGRCDVVLTGGVEASISPLIFAGFDKLGAMSIKNETPDSACRPFSKDRDGFVMAEGAATLILESEEHAAERGAKIYAEVKGYGSSGGFYHPVKPRPGGEDLIDSMNLALQDAQLKADQIDLINPHGTGTFLNDEVELLALRGIFGNHLSDIPIVPTKQLTGHLLGAAGALESLHLIKSISESFVTPIRYWDQSSELNIVTAIGHHSEITHALNNSFGFGNNNVSLIFGKYT